MSGPSFEIDYRDKLWRIELSDFGGQQRLAIWAHYRHRETGEWKPCGGKRDAPGCIVPTERVEEFAQVLNAIAAQLRSDGALAA